MIKDNTLIECEGEIGYYIYYDVRKGYIRKDRQNGYKGADWLVDRFTKLVAGDMYNIDINKVNTIESITIEVIM